MIEGVEWLFIALIVILLVFYDPQKIPQIAKAITQAKKEYEKATSHLAEEITKLDESDEQKEAEKTKSWDPAFPFEHAPESPDMHIVKWARMLKIETYGKTKDEIIREIFEKQKEYFFKDKLQLAAKETVEDFGAPVKEAAEFQMNVGDIKDKVEESNTIKSHIKSQDTENKQT